MLKRKISALFLCASLLVFNLSFTSTVFASSVNSNSVNSNTIDIQNTDSTEINKSINEVLSLSYDTLKTGNAKDYSNTIKDSKLLKLVNKTSNFNTKWFKKFNGKINGYTSNVTINNLTKTTDNTYIVDVVYDVEFKLEGANTTSKAQDNYRFEVKQENGKWYITKMLDLNENKPTTNTDFLDYDNIVNSKLEDIDYKSNNIDDMYQQYKKIEPKVHSSQNKTNAAISGHTASIGNSIYNDFAAYSGYNATNAVAYAQKYAMSPNYTLYPESWTYVQNGVDCTDFVSQAANAGSIPTGSSWFSYTTAWVNVIEFFNYMTAQGYASSVTGPYPTGSNGARAGDVVQFYNPSKSTWSHSVILSGTVNGGTWVYCGHSSPRLDYPLYKGYSENGYTNMRTIKFWH